MFYCLELDFDLKSRIEIHPVERMKVCVKCHGSSSNSYMDVFQS